MAGAAQSLHKFLDPLSVCGSRLLLTIAIDDAQALHAELPNVKETRYSALRQALGMLNTRSFFTLFIPTAWRFESLPEPQAVAPSSVLYVKRLEAFAPITIVPFDVFARKASFDGSWTLTKLASTDYIAHLGRAL